MKSYCTGVEPQSEDVNTCCKQHDADYTEGSATTRKEADRKLRQCMRDAGHPVKAFLFYLAVRTFGWIFWHDHWRNVLNKILKPFKRS